MCRSKTSASAALKPALHAFCGAVPRRSSRSKRSSTATSEATAATMPSSSAETLHIVTRAPGVSHISISATSASMSSTTPAAAPDMR